MQREREREGGRERGREVEGETERERERERLAVGIRCTAGALLDGGDRLLAGLAMPGQACSRRAGIIMIIMITVIIMTTKQIQTIISNNDYCYSYHHQLLPGFPSAPNFPTDDRQTNAYRIWN